MPEIDAAASISENSANIYIGITLSIIASAMNATGLNLQTVASLKKSRLLNYLGIFLSTACGVVDLSSYNYAPQATLAPLGAVTLVINLLLSPIMHGKSLKYSDVLFTFLIVAGVAMCIFGGKSKDDSLSASELYDLAIRKAFRYLIVIAMALIFSLVCFIYRTEKNGAATDVRVGIAHSILAGIFGGITVLGAKVTTIVFDQGQEFLTTTCNINLTKKECWLFLHDSFSINFTVKISLFDVSLHRTYYSVDFSRCNYTDLDKQSRSKSP